MAEGKDEKNSSQAAKQQVEQTTRRAAQSAAEVGGRVAAIGVEVVKRSNESAEHVWEASRQIARQLDQTATSMQNRGKVLASQIRLHPKELVRSAAANESFRSTDGLIECFPQCVQPLTRKLLRSRGDHISRFKYRTEISGRVCERLLGVISGKTKNMAELVRSLIRNSARAAQEATNKISDRIRQVA